jgi:hypothetical protein
MKKQTLRSLVVAGFLAKELIAIAVLGGCIVALAGWLPEIAGALQ